MSAKQGSLICSWISTNPQASRIARIRLRDDKKDYRPGVGCWSGARHLRTSKSLSTDCGSLWICWAARRRGSTWISVRTGALWRDWRAGKRVLNAFSFTGAFAVHALAEGAAYVTNVDTSFEALEGAEAALRLNHFDPDAQAEGIHGDVFQVLRGFREEGRQFDMVILDPPKFARSKADLDGAARGYKDINLLGMKLLAPGGVLATFSCSGLVTPDLFQKIVFGASIDAGRPAQVVARLTQAPDHPLLLTFPEGEYLKGLLARMVD